jgi:hypothetical protein
LTALAGRGDGTAALSRDGGVAWLALLAILFVVHFVWHRTKRRFLERLPAWQWGLVHGAAWSFVLAAQHVGYVPFVYFQF